MKRISGLLIVALALLAGGAVVALWTPDIAHEELVARYASTESRFVRLPSGAVAHYRVQGNANGQTLVLLHGSNASLHTWEPWVRELGSHLRVVTVDLPGHGLTGPTPAGDYTYTGMINFVREFTQAIELKRFILGGNSMGGAVTLSFALAWPDDLAGIVLLDAAGLDLPFGPGSRADLPLAFRLAGKWYASWVIERITPRSLVEEGLLKSFSNPALVDEAMVQRYWDLARHPGSRAATAARFAWYRDGRRALAVENIAVPTLIVWGEQDRLIPLEVGQQMHAKIAGSVFVPLPGVGHVPQEEAARESAAMVTLFASGIGAGRIAGEAAPSPQVP